MFNGSRPLVAQMHEQDVAELTAGAPPQRVQNGFVFAHRFSPPLSLARKIGRVANPANPSGEVGVSAPQRRVARGFDDLQMDQLIDVEIAVHIAVQVKPVHLIMQPLDLGDFGIGNVFAGQAPGKTFKPAHDIEQFGKIALAQLPNARAAVGQELDQSFGGQYFQSFTQRRARDAQHLAKLPFGYTAAVRDIAFDDMVSQPR